MTREEAIEVLKDIYNYTRFDTYTTNEARTMAIEVLEQEPCEDVISREEAIDSCNQSVNILEATDRIKDLPPVTPQEPFMNKPCIAHQICHEDKVKVLDKIRAEIEKIAKPNELGGRGNGKSIRYGLCMALDIIDKYKAESEDSHEIDRCR